MIINGYVYLISFNLGSELRYKIGFSADPQRRVKDFTTPGELTIVDQYGHEQPQKLEARLHKRFQHQRDGKSEWFKLTPRDVSEFSRSVEEESKAIPSLQPENQTIATAKPSRWMDEAMVDSIARLLLSMPPCPKQ